MDGQEAAGGAARNDGAAVGTRNLGLKGPRGWVFRDITLDADPGSLVVVEGPSGSGRTCLLLTLTGRMRFTEGTATVGGLRLPKKMAALRKVAALGHTAGVSELESALTVAEHLRETALLQSRFGSSLRGLLRPRSERRAAAKLRVDRALEAAGLDVEALPKGPRTAVRDLERMEALRLSLALTLVGEPRLIALDDIDLKLSADERAQIWDTLRSLTDNGLTVIAVAAEAPEGAVVVSTAPAADAAAADSKAGSADAAADTRPDAEEAKAQDTKENGDALAQARNA